MLKDIPNFEGIYKIDENGQVISYAQTPEGKVKKWQIDKHGYASVHLYKNGLLYSYFIHRLVLMAFNPVENMDTLYVNHLDCNPLNNNINNLEWTTQKENNMYIEKVGHHSGRPKQKVKVEYLNGNVEYYDSINDCARHFNINRSTVQDYIKVKCSPRRTIQANFSIVE